MLYVLIKYGDEDHIYYHKYENIKILSSYLLSVLGTKENARSCLTATMHTAELILSW